MNTNNNYNNDRTVKEQPVNPIVAQRGTRGIMPTPEPKKTDRQKEKLRLKKLSSIFLMILLSIPGMFILFLGRLEGEADLVWWGVAATIVGGVAGFFGGKFAKTKLGTEKTVIALTIAFATILLALLLLPFIFGGGFARGSGQEWSQASSIFVSGGNVYMAGSINRGTSQTDRPTLWINGEPQPVGRVGNFNQANAVFVSGSDIYVVTTENMRPFLWRNGVSQQLSENSGRANSVFVSGNDVFVVGDVWENRNRVPTLWRNGVPQHLGRRGTANYVTVSNGDVFVVGYEGDSHNERAIVWKNGDVHFRSDENRSRANSIFISEGNMYVAGQIDQRTAVWRNNILQEMESGGPAHSIVVANGNVYVAGGGTRATFWKNGIRQEIDPEFRVGIRMTLAVVGNRVYLGGSRRGSCPLLIVDIGDFQNGAQATQPQTPIANNATVAATTPPTQRVEAPAPPPQSVYQGVVINGVRWATRNVDAPGTFAANPESAGQFFQWNRRQGWSATGNVSGWNAAVPTSTSWIRTNDPCPQGWRVPTEDELRALMNADSTWTTRNGVNGRLFGTVPNQIFLPATGDRHGDAGSLQHVGEWGHYWSSTQYGNEHAWNLHFSSGFVLMFSNRRVHGFSVRCVAQ